MKCPKCETKIERDDLFCPQCGAKIRTSMLERMHKAKANILKEFEIDVDPKRLPKF